MPLGTLTISEDGLLADYLTREQLAEELGVCVRTIDRWRALGEGPKRTRIGIRTLYHRDDVKAWLRDCKEAV